MAHIELERSDTNSQRGEEESVKEKLMSKQHKEAHLQTGEFLKSIIYGALDGTTATVIIILSGISYGTAPYDIFGIAVSALIADSICMGFGDYLSAKAEIQYIHQEKVKIMNQIETKMEEEKQDLITIYSAVEEGSSQPRYSEADARRLSDLIANSKEALTNILMLNKVKLAPIDPSAARKCGITTFFSFIIFGFIPIIPYFVSVVIMHKEDEHELIPVVCLGVVEFFSLGFAKGALISTNKVKAGLQVLFFGAMATGIGYGIGFLFEI